MPSRLPGFRPVLTIITFAGLLIYWLTADFFGYEIIAEIAVFAILAMALDFLAGYGGLVSLAQGALFGIGAYAFAYSAATWEIAVPWAMILAVVISGAVALIVGALASGVTGIFFIMITLALGEMAHEFFFKSPLFGGDDGFFGIPRLDLTPIGIDLMDPATFTLLLLVCVLAVFLKLRWLVASPYGLTLIGLHENSHRLRALGLPVRLYKTTAFALAGAISGFAGSLIAQHTSFISPQLLHWTTSGEILVMLIVGGLGTLIGPLVGVTLVVLLKHQLGDYTDYWQFWLGLVLIAVVLSGRNGVVGALEDLCLYILRKSGRREPKGEKTSNAAG
ncbi:MAG: branched-chain amino acid ABC transporter permease [Pseudomonadota bacterium]